MAKRRATLTDLNTGEVVTVERGTPEYESYIEQGYISKEKLSHQREYQPDEIESPQEINTDYPTADEAELLKQRIEEMYDAITQKLEEIPNEKVTYVHHTANYRDLTDTKQELLSMVDDLFAESDDTVIAMYIQSVLPQISNYVETIYYDSDDDQIEFHITMIAKLLNKGQALTMEQAQSIGNATDYSKGQPLGWYEKSSMLRDRY